MHTATPRPVTPLWTRATLYVCVRVRQNATPPGARSHFVLFSMVT